MPPPRQIDWRSEFQRLAPFVAQGNGIVRITYDGDECAWHRFSAILKHRFSEAPGERLSVRIDRQWHTTRLLEDIIAEFERKLTRAGFPAPAVSTAPKTIKLLSENSFFGDAEINVEAVHTSGASPYELVQQRDAAIESICARIQAFLDSSGHLMVVLNHAPLPDQAPFWNHFWRNGLERLVPAGLLLIHFHDRGCSARLHARAPDPGLQLVLPRDFHDDARQDDAFDDLIDVLEDRGYSREEAGAAALSHINSNAASVEGFHNNLASLLWRVDAVVASRLPA